MSEVEAVFVVGSWARPEFDEARDWLQSRARVTRFIDVASAERAILAADEDPHRIIFVQARPGQFHQSEVKRLRQLAPLTQLTVLLGSWCEGETRSGKPIVDVQRMAWNNLRSRMPFSAEDARSDSILPFTTTEQDRCRFDLRSRRPLTPWRIGVYSADPAQVAALCVTLNGNGHQSIPYTTDEFRFADAIVWDDAGGARVPRVSVSKLRAQFQLHNDVPIITLRTFVRIQDVESDRTEGASATILKPFQVADLLTRLSMHLTESSRRIDAA